MGTYLRNKKAGFNYTINETFEAGISLLGFEVKSIKSKLGSLSEAFVIEEDNELYLIKSYIPPYQGNNTIKTYDPYRRRKILLKRSEIDRLKTARNTEGLTLIPIRLYNKNNLIKLEVALAKGKKKSDKRESIKKRDDERDIGRKLKNRN